MPRPLQPIDDGLIYHVINRSNNRQPVFHKLGDFVAFLKALAELKARKPFVVLFARQSLSFADPVARRINQPHHAGNPQKAIVGLGIGAGSPY